MKKNTASQVIGAQLVSATDGSAFTGSVTVYVTGDAGTQAAGSVGSGACTHEGNGYHTYAPAQAETNYDLVAFTFIGTGAVPTTVQIYTRPTTDYATQASVDVIDGIVDSILVDTAEIGAAGAGLTALATAAALATVDTVVDSILVDTAEIGAAGAGLTALATAANLATVAGYLDTEIAAILTDTNELQTDLVNGGRLDLLIDAIKAVTDAQGATGSGLTSIPWNAAWDAEVQSECADALAALVIEGSFDLVEVMKVLLAFAAGKTDITGSTYTFRDQADTLNRISATVTAGERTAVTLNVT